MDAFRATVLPKALVKKVSCPPVCTIATQPADWPQLNKEIYDQFVPNNLTAVLAGLAKIFVADVIETGELVAGLYWPVVGG